MNKLYLLVTVQKRALGNRPAVVVRRICVDHDSFYEQDIGFPKGPPILGTMPPWHV
jgi:hypothetical protein